MENKNETRNARFNASMLSVEALLDAYAIDVTKAAIFSDHGETAARHYAALDGEFDDALAALRDARHYAAICIAASRLQQNGHAKLVPTLWLIFANGAKYRRESVHTIMRRQRGRGKRYTLKAAWCRYNRDRDELINFFGDGGQAGRKGLRPLPSPTKTTTTKEN